MQYLPDNPLRDKTMGESILWEGKPAATFGSILNLGDLFLIPFSILWTGFAVFWMASAYMMGAPILFTLFGTPFVLVGVYMVFGRFISAYLSIRGTYYLLTDRRVLIQAGLSKAYTSFGLDQLGPLTVSAGSDGSGSIYYTPPAIALQNPVGVSPLPVFGALGMLPVLFKNIENVEQVHRMLLEAKDGLKP
jgi:hypothetical protein